MGYNYFDFAKLSYFEIDELITNYNEEHMTEEARKERDKLKLLEKYDELMNDNIENGKTRQSGNRVPGKGSGD